MNVFFLKLVSIVSLVFGIDLLAVTPLEHIGSNSAIEFNRAEFDALSRVRSNARSSYLANLYPEGVIKHETMLCLTVDKDFPLAIEVVTSFARSKKSPWCFLNTERFYTKQAVVDYTRNY